MPVGQTRNRPTFTRKTKPAEGICTDLQWHRCRDKASQGLRHLVLPRQLIHTRVTLRILALQTVATAGACAKRSGAKPHGEPSGSTGYQPSQDAGNTRLTGQ